MIRFLSNWIEQIAIAVIIASIFELILPKGSLKKYVKVVLGVYVVFSIISPFVNSSALYDTRNITIEALVENIVKTNQTTVNQESMDLRLEKLYIDELKSDIKNRVKEYGYDIYKCDIDANLKNSSENPGIHKINLILKEVAGGIEGIERVNINIRNETESQSEESESSGDIENIKKDLANYYEISTDIITIHIK